MTDPLNYSCVVRRDVVVLAYFWEKMFPNSRRKKLKFLPFKKKRQVTSKGGQEEETKETAKMLDVRALGLMGVLVLMHATAAFSFSLFPSSVLSAGLQKTPLQMRPVGRQNAARQVGGRRMCMLGSPLSDGDSSRLFQTVSEMEPGFLPPIGGAAIEPTENSTVLPLFPLGAVVYTPFSEHRFVLLES